MVGENKYNVPINIKTNILPTNEIEQIVEMGEGIYKQVIRSVCDLREEHIKQALIKLGWTPPKKEN
jgi:hypothetical protein